MARRDVLTRSRKKKAQQLAQAGRIPEACQLFGQICQLDPLDYTAWLNFGAYSGQLGRLDDAQRAFKQALQLKPDEASISFNLARLSELKQDLQQAESYYLRYLKLKPQALDGLKALARLYLNIGRLDEAARTAQQAMSVVSDDPALLNLYANILQDQERYDEAYEHYQLSLKLGANPAEVYANLGNLFHAQDDFEQSLSCYKKSLELAPRSVATLNSLGFLYYKHGCFKEAHNCYEQALKLDPGNHAVRWNRSLLLLTLGEFKQGWQDYESRNQTVETVRQFGRHDVDKPRWDGAEIKDKTLLVIAEQGLGDTLQFCRYLPLIRERVGRLLFECPTKLEQVLQTLPGVDRLIVQGDEAAYAEETIDCYLPLLSLPAIYGTDFEHLPNFTPYLFADQQRREHWRSQLNTAQYKVGLVWGGNPKNPNDRRRSMSLNTLLPLFNVPGVSFYSLQFGELAKQLEQLPSDVKVVDLGPQLEEFADNAALLSELDLLICVDTAAAHLAGALGRPVWNLLPAVADWRWFIERTDSPWYPAMRLFRQQQQGDWGSVIAEVCSALTEQVAMNKHSKDD